MGYGWAMVFTMGAWLVGGFLEGLLGADTLGLHTLFAIIAMGCYIMKFIKDNNSGKALRGQKRRLYTVGETLQFERDVQDPDFFAGK